MNLDEFIIHLKILGVDENTLIFAVNCYEMGKEFGFDEAKQKIKEKIDEMKAAS